MSASEASEMDTLGTVPLWIKAELAENEVIAHPDADNDTDDTDTGTCTWELSHGGWQWVQTESSWSKTSSNNEGNTPLQTLQSFPTNV